VKALKNSEPNRFGITEEGETKTGTELPVEVETRSIVIGDEKISEKSNGTTAKRMQLPN